MIKAIFNLFWFLFSFFVKIIPSFRNKSKSSLINAIEKHFITYIEYRKDCMTAFKYKGKFMEKLQVRG